MLVPRFAWVFKYPMILLELPPETSRMWQNICSFHSMSYCHFIYINYCHQRSFQILRVSWNLVHNVCSKNEISGWYLKSIVLLLYTFDNIGCNLYSVITLVHANKWVSKCLVSMKICSILQYFVLSKSL